ncbi:MAG TPA: type II toxin-antitoxin system VapC family toxin [Geminicoccaceae bacterium]|nr:type II toxin-antitoxin system VapC family toxin [Geminicoccaceae bacterium]
MGSYAWTTTLRLAERFGLTIYDATYLELAQRHSLPLATHKELRNAAATLDVTLLG